MSYEHFQNKTRPPAGAVEKKGLVHCLYLFFVCAYLNDLGILKAI